ncbi:hypothetical protein DENIS_0377 [Desulfonema ishimotonii]|uniref:Uncharacterized protein n=1 Tax=Desulfonema ishimotonii TaxID=45657 RepID=A0A401FR41_9BACT|nr:hypothetical protein [Desulfonema ishimotonii]GBC59438.1 hypothetical protein DENIS_0377 [Desulfonema ishimotonii]
MTTITVPPSTDRIWYDIVTGKVTYQFDFIAAKILMGRLRVKVRHNPGPGVIRSGARELWEVFDKNVRMPSVQKDMKKIWDRRVR